MTALPILYSFRRCPYAMRARMAVTVSGVRVELREIILREKPPKMLEISPKATVPVLHLPDGAVIDESLDVMYWALRQNDPQDWLERIDEGLIAANDGPFKHALDRYKYPHRYDLADGLEHRNAATTHLGALDGGLAKTRFLHGKAIGFTDIALFPFVRQFAATDVVWFEVQPLPHLQRWLAELAATDLFASIMVRYPAWKSGAAPTFFP